MAKMTSIGVLLALASIYRLHVHKIYVKTTFLNGKLNEEVCIEQNIRLSATEK